MASKGSTVLKPALAPSETCSNFTLNCEGVLSVLRWCHSANKHVPVRGRERNRVLTLWNLCLLNQTERKHQLLRIHPFVSALQRTVQLRCPSQGSLYPWARKQWRSRACFSPHWGQEKTCLKKNWWSFSKEVAIFLPFPAAVSVLSHCSLSMAGEQVQGRRFGRQRCSSTIIIINISLWNTQGFLHAQHIEEVPHGVFRSLLSVIVS